MAATGLVEHGHGRCAPRTSSATVFISSNKTTGAVPTIESIAAEASYWSSTIHQEEYPCAGGRPMAKSHANF
jgi:hypothetical protein